MRLIEIGAIVRSRREEVGLSMQQLATFSEMDVNTLTEMENGRLADIGYNQLDALLQLPSLSFENLSISTRLGKRGLWMAAKNVSVSYRTEISPDILGGILCSGLCPPEYVSNIGHFLDETPLELVIMAVEEVATHPIERQKIWLQVGRLASQYGSTRSELWASKL